MLADLGGRVSVLESNINMGTTMQLTLTRYTSSCLGVFVMLF